VLGAAHRSDKKLGTVRRIWQLPHAPSSVLSQAMGIDQIRIASTAMVTCKLYSMRCMLRSMPVGSAQLDLVSVVEPMCTAIRDTSCRRYFCCLVTTYIHLQGHVVLERLPNRLCGFVGFQQLCSGHHLEVAYSLRAIQSANSSCSAAAAVWLCMVVSRK